jgi:hypothetical protein
MRFSLQPEPRDDQRMHIVGIDEIVLLCEREAGRWPSLEQYFSPTKKETFIKEFLHYLNTELLEARHGHLTTDQYLVFVLSFQFTAPMLMIPTEKELGLFYRILQKNYKVDEIDLNLHFSIGEEGDGMVGEREALETYRHELMETYNGLREVKEIARRKIKQDAIEAIMGWQKEQSLPALAEAFGRSIVIPSFFSFWDKRLERFYRSATEEITYRVSIPGEIEGTGS